MSARFIRGVTLLRRVPIPVGITILIAREIRNNLVFYLKIMKAYWERRKQIRSGPYPQKIESKNLGMLGPVCSFCHIKWMYYGKIEFSPVVEIDANDGQNLLQETTHVRLALGHV